MVFPANNMVETVTTNLTTRTQKPSEKITYAISDSKQFYHYHIELAKNSLINQGYNFEQVFLDVRRGREAFATKQVQIVSTSPIFLMSLAEQGESVLFGPTTYINLFVIIAREDFDEKNVSKPLNVGISLITSIGHYFATLFLKEMGVAEVNWAQIGSSRDRIAALINGSIDLSAVQYDEALNAIMSGAEIKILGQPRPFWVVMGLYEDWLEQNHEFVKDLVKSLILAKIYCRLDKEKHVNESIKYAEREPSSEILKLVRDTYGLYDRENFWGAVVAPDSFYEDLSQWSVENKVIEGKVDFRQLNQPIRDIAEAALKELLKS